MIGSLDESAAMHLKPLTPTEVLLDETVAKINAERPDGQFCLFLAVGEPDGTIA